MAVSRSEGGLGLMSCVRESSPPDALDAEDLHHEPKKRRFHPLRGLRRIFRRKERARTATPPAVTVSADELSRERAATVTTATQEDPPRRSSSGLHSGLSLSHDSVFSPEQRSGPDSDLETSSSLSVQRLIHNTGVQAELVDAVRRRRPRDDTSDDEDLGLPRSPPSNSPTHHHIGLKEGVSKSNHSTCSDGSLLSMASSEMDEDSCGQSSGHGSKLSLHEKKSDGGVVRGGGDEEVEVTSEPLSHSAARHKMSVKPRRTHGVPRKRRSTQLGEVTTLPATPEVNEESISSIVSVNAALPRSITPDLPASVPSDHSASVGVGTQLKSASLPPGTTPAWLSPAPAKLSRSRSTAAAPAPSQTPPLDERDEPDPPKREDTTFFGRLLSRRSGKKKKTVEEPPLELPQKRMDEKGQYVHEVTKLGRHHPAARQRVEPINLTQDRTVSRMQVFYPPSPPPPDSPPRHRDADILDDENTLEGRSPLRKIIPLEVDSSIPKRTFVKKSQSFRRDEALPFVSLDTPSLPLGLGTDLKQDGVEDLNELTTLEVVDHHLSDSRTEEAKEVTSTVMINSSTETDSCEVTVTREDVRELTTEAQVRKSLSLDSVNSCEVEPANRKSASSESITHQITIPVGSSVVNITQVVNKPQQTAATHGIKPEPRKSLREGNREVPNFYPVPAPRPSKRESLEAKPPRVPEFLRVQLNHVDREPTINVVLSTLNGSNAEEKNVEAVDGMEKNLAQTKEETTESTNHSSRKNSRSDEVDVKVEVIKEDVLEDLNRKANVCVQTCKEPVDPNQVKFLNSVKQWSASPYAISNPNYSIVSIAPRNVEVKKPVEKPTIMPNQSEQKTVIIKEVKEKSPPLSDKPPEPQQVKVVLRQRSFVNDDKPANNLNTEKSSKIEIIEVTPHRKSITKEVFVTSVDSSRKLSLEKLDSRNQENMSDVGRRKSKEISSDENSGDRNSYGSSDTLASQDSGEVVLRRKSLSREIVKQKEEEPELLKVFARRSLKVRDTEMPDDIEALNYPPMKSRDSDKENECGDSPPEERKKIKEHLTESKISEKTVPNVAYKYQRSVSSSSEETLSQSILATSKKDNNSYEKRQRSRTIPDPKIIDPPSSIVTHKVIANIFKEKEVEVIPLEKPDENHSEKEENVPRFKRIQQRKEEWEKRAQLAMKKSLP